TEARQISREEGEQYASDQNATYMESSALLGEGIRDIFLPFIATVSNM
ncbi:MAG: hypothetical protein IH840_15425, partial [Candidatus Heimdallarchaeota archaeon]|nr:hypothetical protein [Candidatus Heimdallarchaeota archaeon]